MCLCANYSNFGRKTRKKADLFYPNQFVFDLIGLIIIENTGWDFCLWCFLRTGACYKQTS